LLLPSGGNRGEGVRIDKYSLKEFLVKINQVDYVFLTVKNVFFVLLLDCPHLDKVGCP
jgi:hypothetical protein